MALYWYVILLFDAGEERERGHLGKWAVKVNERCEDGGLRACPQEMGFESRAKLMGRIDAQDKPPKSCGVTFDRDCAGHSGCIVSAIINQVRISTFSPLPPLLSSPQTPPLATLVRH